MTYMLTSGEDLGLDGIEEDAATDAMAFQHQR
jgi:hypothetical protein